VEHPADASVKQRPSADLNQQPRHPEEPGGHSQSATRAQGDLSHTRPSWAIDSLTEGDLVFGKNMSPVATLVERSTRYLMLVALPSGDHRADTVADALATAITRLPRHLAKSMTWDQGNEMAAHARFTAATGIQVYFCDPKSPWQRGSNENTNGLLRQYLPRRLNFRELTQNDFDAIATQLNDRPRQTLGFKTPSEALAEVLR
jgi:IS30 family transposase